MKNPYQQLGAAIVLQAVKDYFNCVTDAKKKCIIKELRSEYLDQLSSGVSIVVARQLEHNPKEIAKRIKALKN